MPTTILVFHTSNFPQEHLDSMKAVEEESGYVFKYISGIPPEDIKTIMHNTEGSADFFLTFPSTNPFGYFAVDCHQDESMLSVKIDSLTYVMDHLYTGNSALEEMVEEYGDDVFST